MESEHRHGVRDRPVWVLVPGSACSRQEHHDPTACISAPTQIESPHGQTAPRCHRRPRHHPVVGPERAAGRTHRAPARHDRENRRHDADREGAQRRGLDPRSPGGDGRDRGKPITLWPTSSPAALSAPRPCHSQTARNWRWRCWCFPSRRVAAEKDTTHGTSSHKAR